ncbi:hypothetical protein ACFPL7_15280 [Dongia soli]|uniref:Lipoprotein n=1 Tax=Dongia soli TaxID=600628 RepID=A0ABU5ECI2_9PROT|nr:hypothetical protein [Dongia soli]MDY0883740.1 hypothetical protein [Dongia soli]
MFTKVCNLCLISLLLVGCAYREGQRYDVNNPIVRKFSWFSYLDGNDIRESCAAGSADRIRLVYNGQYDAQLRSYDIFVDKHGGAVMNVRAMNNTGNLVNWSTNNIFGPWTWTQSQVTLTSAEVAEFRALLRQSGYGGPAPQGLKLHSQDFYWIAAGCEGGVFHYYAWNNRPQSMARQGFAGIKFQDFLLKRDKTGVTFRPPHVTSPAERASFRRTGGGRAPTGAFELTVRENGLGGLLNAF